MRVQIRIQPGEKQWTWNNLQNNLQRLRKKPQSKKNHKLRRHNKNQRLQVNKSCTRAR